MMQSRIAVFIAVALLAFTACQSQAKDKPKLSIGDPAPPLGGTSVEDREVTLATFKDKDVLVVAFTCNHCPVAKAYEDRFIQFQKDYADKGVQLVAICVNDRDGDRLPGMKKRAEEKGFNFPYIYDESQESGRAYGATCTPHLFVLDGDRRVAYMGSFDDDMKNPETPHVANAVDAILAGKKPEVAVTKQFGCGIKW